MKHLLVLIIALFALTTVASAKSSIELENKVDTIFIPFRSPFALKKEVLNPNYEAGKMLSKASHFKAGALGCAAVSAGVWLIHGKDIKNIKVTRGISIASGAIGVALYACALHFDWMAGKYLRMSASPGGLTATVTF